MATADVNLTVGKRTGDERRVEMPGVVVGDSKQTLEYGEPNNINQNGIFTPTMGPSPYLLHDKKSYYEKCVPLYMAALRGDVEEAKDLLTKYPDMRRAAITHGYQTVLHVAAGTRQTGFVAEIVEFMEPEDLALQDRNGNTAFCFAVVAGNIEIAQMMLAKNPSLLNIRGGQNMTPLYLAALFGQRKISTFLYKESALILEIDDRRSVFFISINTGLYDLALKLLKYDKDLAVARHVEYGTALHVLARNPSAFAARRAALLDRLINSFPGNKSTEDPKMMSTQALELVKCLWKEIMLLDHADVLKLTREPSKLLFDAAKLGNFEFLAALIRSYPDLVHELDEDNRSIFHIAVMYRHTNIFNLIYEIGFNKDLIATYKDKKGNNILHLAAQYPPPNPVTIVSGAALEMQQELLTFKEVEKIVQPPYREMKNRDEKTPRELFIMEHKDLLKSGEQWMKSTAKTCMIVATLIVTVVFAATAWVPNGEIGTSFSYNETLFQVFAIAKATALSSSSISVLTFLSILTSRFAENDFLRLLPFQLMVGLSTLFISLISTVVAFSSTFLLAYHDRISWFSLLAIVLASLPVIVIVLLQYPLFKHIFCSINRSRFLL